VRVLPSPSSMLLRVIAPDLQRRSYSLLSASPSVVNRCNRFFHLSRHQLHNPLEETDLQNRCTETREAQTLISPVVMRILSDGVVFHGGALQTDPDHDKYEPDTDDTPVTPLDEPRPTRIQNPSPRPEYGLYVVQRRRG
jgi:hypothetical protein